MGSWPLSVYIPIEKFRSRVGGGGKLGISKKNAFGTTVAQGENRGELLENMVDIV